MSLADVQALNPQIKNPNLIFPGQSVKLGDSQAPGASGGLAIGDNPGQTVFPTSSTYPPPEQSLSAQEAERATGRLKNLGNKIKGWGFGSTPSDPAKNAMYISSERNTNPLDIKDKGHGGSNSG